MFKKILNRLKGRAPAKEVFSDIHKKNLWRDSESLSGPGSNSLETQQLVPEIRDILNEYPIKTVLDVPCGDFNWMKNVSLAGINYIGGDIVEELVEQNNRRWGKPNICFKTIDIIEDILPMSDLLIVRDCLVHFPDDLVYKALQNMVRSGCDYLLTTTFNKRSGHIELKDWGWRPINLEEAPFFFPEPVKLVPEHHPSEEWKDKCLGLWKMKDIETVQHHWK